MKCIECNSNEAIGKGKYCSSKCRQTHYRNANRNTNCNDGPESVTVRPKAVTVGKPDNFGQPDCNCMHCQTKRVNGSKNIINHGPWKSANQLAVGEFNRVTLPGDVDYDGVCNDSHYDDRRISMMAKPHSSPTSAITNQQGSKG